VLLAMAGATGCAGNTSSPVAVRVGGVAIDQAAVDHLARAVTLGTPVAGALGRSSSTPRQTALDFLISADWAIEAAAERGLGVSDGAVERGVKERTQAVPNGRSEFEKEIASTGQTLGDVKLEVKAALATARLRDFLSKRVAPVTQAQIADYYKRHPQRFRIPNRRRVDLIEAIHGYGHAIALGKQLGPGKRFAEKALHELVARQAPYEEAHRENHQLIQAIFTATPGRVARPVSFNDKWVLLVVRKLVPGSIKPLSKVSAHIAERLSSERQRQAMASFLEAYRREWTAKTRCHTGFVVQNCSEYRGPLEPESSLLVGE